MQIIFRANYRPFRFSNKIRTYPSSSLSGISERKAFEVLGLSPTSNLSEIKKKYFEKVKTFHPDNKNSGNPEKFHEIRKAYELLLLTKSDPSPHQSASSPFPPSHPSPSNSNFHDDKREFSSPNDRYWEKMARMRDNQKTMEDEGKAMHGQRLYSLYARDKRLFITMLFGMAAAALILHFYIQFQSR